MFCFAPSPAAPSPAAPSPAAPSPQEYTMVDRLGRASGVGNSKRATADAATAAAADVTHVTRDVTCH